MRTFNYLQDKDIIFNKRGIGYFVSEDGFQKTMTLRKEIFVDHELPKFFKEMELLNLSLKDVEAYYKKHTEKQK